MNFFNKLYPKPQEVTSLHYTKRIPRLDKGLEQAQILITKLDKNFTVITEKPSFPSNIYFSMFFHTGSRTEKEGSLGVLQCIKNSYFGSKESLNLAQMQLVSSDFQVNYNYDYTIIDGFTLPHEFPTFISTISKILFDKWTEQDQEKLNKRHQEFWAGHQDISLEQFNQEVLLKHVFSSSLSQNIHGTPDFRPKVSEINSFIQENFIENPGVLYISGVENHEETIKKLEPFLSTFKATAKTYSNSSFVQKETWESFTNDYCFLNLSFESFPILNPKFRYLEVLRLLYQVSGFSSCQSSNIIKSFYPSHHSFRDVAAFTLTGVCAPSYLDKVSDLLSQEFQGLLKVRTQEFELAKRYYLMEVFSNFEDVRSRSENYLKEFWYFNRLTDLESTVKEIEQMSFDEFVEILRLQLQGKINLTVLSNIQKQKITLDKFKIKTGS